MTFYILSDERGDRFGTIEDGEGFEARVKLAIGYYHGDGVIYKNKIEPNTSFTIMFDNDYQREFYLEPTCIFKRGCEND